MSDSFRALLAKVGSGPHTSKALTREEAAAATRMMLHQEATPAQIGAFLIAHRIKRPTAEELAGMLDTYAQLGPQLAPIPSPHPVMVLGSPYDGRSRTAPLSILTALILSAAGISVIMHGGDVMPTKYGLPLVTLWQQLGVDWTRLSLKQVQQVLEDVGLGFVYLPHHFPLAQGLVTYRDQVGKRPPLASLELMWCPYQGEALVVAGYVHPPTEQFMVGALALRGQWRFVLVKGLEGSCDLPRHRPSILGLGQPDQPLTRLVLKSRDYELYGPEIPLQLPEVLAEAFKGTIVGKPGSLTDAAVWNGGFYLWQGGISTNLADGLRDARQLLATGQVAQQWQRVQQALPQ
jgi:anthranilate phosphoribosyltransferase